MPEPVVAQKKPYLVELKAGRDYLWCSCGRSAKQPYCDGSHAGTPFMPLRLAASKDEEVVLCGCKHTCTPPFCDGTHNKLSERYQEATEDELSAAASLPLARRDHGGWGKAILAEGCFVLTPAAELFERRGTSMRLAPVIHRGDGARFISQFCAEIDPGSEDILNFPQSEAVLFIRSGMGTVIISGREFPVAPETGVLVRPGEGFHVRPDGETMRLLLTACPQAQAPESLALMPKNFDESVARRAGGVDASLGEPMADRFYQILVGERPGGLADYRIHRRDPFVQSRGSSASLRGGDHDFSWRGVLVDRASPRSSCSGRHFISSPQSAAFFGMHVAGRVAPDGRVLSVGKSCRQLLILAAKPRTASPKILRTELRYVLD
jgi:CDGSH-type Zn-finger protein